MRLSRKLRLRLAMLGCALGCLIVLIALLSAPSPANYTDHKFGAGAGESGPSGSEQSGAGDTPSSHSHQHAHGSGVPDANTTDDSDPGFGSGYTFAGNNPWGTNPGSSGQGGHPYPGNSGISFGDGRGFGGGGGFGGGFGGFGYFPQGSGKQDGGDGSEDSGDAPLTTASLFQPGPGTDTDQPDNNESAPGDGPDDYTPPTLRFDDPSIDKITEDLPSDPPGGDKPNGLAPVQVPEPPSWSMLVLALLGMAFWRMRATRQASFH